MKAKRALVTGGAGFIGSHLVDRLIEDRYEVRVLDNLSTGSLENIKGHLGRRGFHFMKGDIANPSALRRALKSIQVVFHEAALTSVPESISDPIATNEVNTTGTLKLLEASVKCGVQRLIYASSASIYGEQRKQPVKEDSTPRPMSPYAVSKLAAENYCMTFNKLHGLETVCLRYFNVYGPRQNFNSYSGVVAIFQDRVRRNRPPIIHGDGTQTRDFVSVLDVVEANMLAMKTKNAAGEIFNVGTGRRTSILRLAEMIIRASKNSHLRPIHAPTRLGDVKHGYADIRKARTRLGYSPSVLLDRYIAKLDISSISIRNAHRKKAQ